MKIRFFKNWLSAPFVWILLLPLVILDIFLEIYHHICFPLYGIEKVKRSQYMRIDRHKLKYLGVRDKLICVFCGYTNGLIRYLQEIAGRTERAWYRMMRWYIINEPLFRKHYHKRSNVETTFSMIKRKFTSYTLSKEHKGQINEILLKVVCQNISVLIHAIFELGIETDFQKYV